MNHSVQHHHEADGEDRGVRAPVMDDAPPPTRPRRRTAKVFLGAIALGLVIGAWWWPSGPAMRKAPGQQAAGQRSMVVEPAPLSLRLTVVGTVGPGRTTPVVAPFDGTVREKPVAYGDAVADGQTVLVLDAGEIENEVREAQAAVIKAAMQVETLARWKESADVARARLTLDVARAKLDTLERQVRETKTLLERGIVSRNEYHGQVEQRDAQRLTVATSKQDLESTLDKGNAANRHLADLELASARARLEAAKAQLAGRVVRAPAAGIVIRPPETATAQTAAVVESGSRVTRGQPLFAIADTTMLVIAAKVDEIDVNHVRVGQSVTIDGDAFAGQTVRGRIAGVSAEAVAGEQDGRAPSFEVRATLADLDARQRRRIRIGMSARLTIDIRTDRQAIVVPIAAVHGADATPGVMVRDGGTGRPRLVPVTLGATTPTGVEIRSGLSPGDEVLVPEAAMAAHGMGE